MIMVFAGQTFYHFIIYADYRINTQAFAQNCENKKRPQMHCNGKCQMMKRIGQNEKKDKELPTRKGEEKTLVLSSRSFYCNYKPLIYCTYKVDFLNLSSSKPIDYSSEIFHPPAFFIS